MVGDFNGEDIGFLDGVAMTFQNIYSLSGVIGHEAHRADIGSIGDGDSADIDSLCAQEFANG